MSGALAARLGAALDRRLDPAVAAFARRLGEEAGALAVLFYGSNLRTGSLDGVLDFYVLLPGPRERGLWPRVSYREWDHAGVRLRAKIATMRLATFAAAAAGETLDTTIWARFVQPCALTWSRGKPAEAAVVRAFAAAAATAARLAAIVGPARGREEEFWRALFRATYRAELRVEPAGRENAILAANAAHFDGLLPVALGEAGIAFARDGATIAPRLDPAERRRILTWWNRRRRLGKLLNLARLARATTTFDGGMRYAAWKVERHTGMPVKVTPLRERFPLVAAPGVVWLLWRSRRRARRESGAR
ncbi:MAG TPA: hypothetical protein VEB68_00255 [Croceibacterium sp.]|nr:hypothetical protein [Croceibacterium sp.]